MENIITIDSRASEELKSILSSMDKFGGFEIQYLEEDSFHGLYVKPQIMPDNGGGCSSCGGGCH